MDTYTAKLLQQFKSDALSADVPWKEEIDGYYTFADLGGVNLEITDSGSVELSVWSPSKPQGESLYVMYVHEPDATNSSIMRELFQEYLADKLFELNRHRWWSSPELVIKKDDDYYSPKDKKNIKLDNRSSLTPILLKK